MRTALSALAASKNPVAQWLFACNGHYWTNGDEITVGANDYVSLVKQFDGIFEKAMDPVKNLIPKSETAVYVLGSKLDYDRSAMVGQDCMVSIHDGSSVVYSWGYTVKNLTYHMGVWTFRLVDFLSPHLEKKHPALPLVSGIETAKNVSYAGDDQACIPEIFGRAFIPVRGAFVTDARYHFIGPSGDTYTIYGAASPVEWDEPSSYDAGSYTFNQSDVAGYAAVQALISATGGVGNFYRSGQNYDMPLDYSRASTASMTNHADVMAHILQQYIPSSQINLTGSWATAKATFAAITGLELNVGFHVKQSLKKTLCQLCTSCNSILRRSDKIDMAYMDDVSARNYDRNGLLNFSFSEIENDTTYDGTSVGYWPDVQGGDPTTITVPVDGSSSSNPDSDTLEVIGLTDTAVVQKIGIRHARAKYLKIGTVSFNGTFSMDIECGDKFTITGDDLYQDFSHCYVESVKINADLSVQITAGVYSAALGDLDTFSPVAVTPDEDDSAVIRPLSEKWLRTLFIRSATLPDLPVDENPAGWSENQPAGTDPLYMIQAWFGPDGHFWIGCTWMAVNRVEGLDGDDGADGINGADGVNGSDGVSIIWQGTFASHPSSPENGWAYRNSTDGRSYVYQDSTWYQMTIDGTDGAAGADGTDGISIVWMGESASPPASPEINWVYKDTDNGIVYIYNGTAWEVMAVDGTDGAAGADGADGSDGLSVEVQYSTDGSSWHDTYVSGDIYLRQRVGESGTWSAAIKFVGDDGATGDTGPGINYTGEYSAALQYYATAIHRDIVLSGGTFYACLQSCLGIPVTNTAYWESLGTNFSAVATNILLTGDATFLRSAIIGWSDTTGHLYDCALRSGMSDPDTGTGFYFGRLSGDAVASVQNASGIFKIDESDNTFQMGNSTLLIDFETAEIYLASGADLTIAGGVSLEGGAGLVLKSGADFTIQDGGNFVVQDGGSATVEGGGDLSFISTQTDKSVLRFFDGASDSNPIAMGSVYGGSYIFSLGPTDAGTKAFYAGTPGTPWYHIENYTTGGFFVVQESSETQGAYISATSGGIDIGAEATGYGNAYIAMDHADGETTPKTRIYDSDAIDITSPGPITVGSTSDTITINVGDSLMLPMREGAPANADIPEGHCCLWRDSAGWIGCSWKYNSTVYAGRINN